MRAEVRARIEATRNMARTRPHGTRARYVADRCRCLLCRAANSRYQTKRDREKRRGDRRDLVAADTVRDHILALRAAGIGYKTIADVARTSPRIVSMISRGTQARVRRHIERRILDVNAECAADGMLVSARPTWDLLNELIDDGWTRTQLARLIGQHSGLQVMQTRVKAWMERRVRLLYEDIQAGRIQRAPTPRSTLTPEDVFRRKAAGA